MPPYSDLRKTGYLRKRKVFSRKKKIYKPKYKKYSRSVPSLAKTTYINRLISNRLKNVSEQKIVATIPQVEIVGQPTAIGSQILTRCFVTGTVPSNWTGNMIGMQGFPSTRGDLADQFSGDYVYLRKTTLSMILDQNTTLNGSPPQQFRIIVFKRNAKYANFSNEKDPSESLFLDPEGLPCGPQTAGQTGAALMMHMTNKKDWTIYRDMKFTMQAPSTLSGSGSADAVVPAGVYKNSRQFRFYLNHFKKVHFGEFEIDDYDNNFGVYVISRNLGADGGTAKWEVNMQGSTTYQDN